jgi:hypothetical protein
MVRSGGLDVSNWKAQLLKAIKDGTARGEVIWGLTYAVEGLGAALHADGCLSDDDHKAITDAWDRAERQMTSESSPNAPHG